MIFENLRQMKPARYLDPKAKDNDQLASQSATLPD